MQSVATGNTIVDTVDGLIRHAIDVGASDIHLEPHQDILRVRLRIDGVMIDYKKFNIMICNQIVSRLKVLSHINVTQKRVPQDGKFSQVHQGRELDMRVSTFPSLYGEHMVIRILNRTQRAISLESLGLSQSMRSKIESIFTRSSGFMLAAGPTGCGKTTSLYAGLYRANSPDKHIITLEDPVEYFVPGITQGHINPDAGFTFEKGMRSILRQDPDIIMVGEIRDTQTARIAIQAALTGHLVLSTIHTIDAPSVVMRLMDMGIEPYLINAALSGVLAQRLVRTICDACKTQRTVSDEEKRILDMHEIDLEAVYQGSGCSQCNYMGTKGRIGIFELLHISTELRSLIVQHPSFNEVVSQARKDGCVPLFFDGIEKVKAGIVSLPELLRVVF